MAWPKNQDPAKIFHLDVRRIGHFKSFCRKCSCNHPGDSEMTGFLKGCMCNPGGRRGECGLYVPTDNLEYLEYLSMIKEQSK